MNRRFFLRSAGAAAITALAGCNTNDGSQTVDGTQTSTDSPTNTARETETPTEKRTETETPPEWEIDPLEHDKLVGAHYYPWYETHQGWQDWLWKTPATAEWVGLPIEDGIEADVYFNGDQTDHVRFGERSLQTYSLSLTG